MYSEIVKIKSYDDCVAKVFKKKKDVSKSRHISPLILFYQFIWNLDNFYVIVEIFK